MGLRSPALILALAIAQALAPFVTAAAEPAGTDAAAKECPSLFKRVRSVFNRTVVNGSGVEEGQLQGKSAAGRVRLVATGVATAAIFGAYQSELGELYGEYIKTPFRRKVRQAYVALSFQVREDHARAVSRAREINARLAGVEASGAEQVPELEKGLGAELSKVSEWIRGSPDAETVPDPKVVSGLSERILFLEKTLLEAREKRGPADSAAKAHLAESAERELAEIYALWTLHQLVGDPEKAKGFDRLARQRLEAGKRFYLENLDRALYARALAAQAESLLEPVELLDRSPDPRRDGAAGSN